MVKIMKIISKMIMGLRYNQIKKAYKDIIAPSSKVLDVGCGDGIISKRLAEDYNFNIAFTDIVNVIDNSNFKLMKQKDKLPFDNGEFEFVMVNDTLHHLDINDQENLIKDIERVGRTIIIFDAEPSLIGNMWDYLAVKYIFKDMDAPLNFKKLDEWVKILEHNGYAVEYAKRLKMPFWFLQKKFMLVASRKDRVWWYEYFEQKEADKK